MMMKHLLTAIACCLAVAGSAQTPVPFNPDADGDELVGVEDLMVTLSLFGQSFTPTLMAEEVFVLPFDSTQGEFNLTTLASIYLIDLRTVDFSNLNSGQVDVEVYLNDENSNPIWFLDGTQFWFLSEYDYYEGWLTVEMYNSNTDINEELNCDEGAYSVTLEPRAPQTYLSTQTPFNYYCAGTENQDNVLPVLSQYVWLNGEMVIIR